MCDMECLPTTTGRTRYFSFGNKIFRAHQAWDWDWREVTGNDGVQ